MMSNVLPEAYRSWLRKFSQTWWRLSTATVACCLSFYDMVHPMSRLPSTNPMLSYGLLLVCSVQVHLCDANRYIVHLFLFLKPCIAQTINMHVYTFLLCRLSRAFISSNNLVFSFPLWNISTYRDMKIQNWTHNDCLHVMTVTKCASTQQNIFIPD